MKPVIKKLSNGLRVVVCEMPYTSLVALSAHVLGGARVEPKEVAGVAHYLEHILFRGSTKYPSQDAVNRYIEATGGEANAFTSEELISCYIHTFRENIAPIMGLLADIWLHPLLSTKDINIERGPILQEKAHMLDDIERKATTAFNKLLWGTRHPLSREIIGTAESISKISAKECRAYHEQFFYPENMVVSVAGSISAVAAFELAEKVFVSNPRHVGNIVLDDTKYLQTPQHRCALLYQESSQAQCFLGCAPFDWISYSSQSSRKDRLVMSILSSILGSGMSSRLFQRVRAEQGLVYTIQSASYIVQDASTFIVTFAADANNVARAIDLVFAEFQALLKNGIKVDELRKVKNNDRRILAEGAENSLQTAMEYGHVVLRGLELKSFEDLYYEDIEPITIDDVMALAEKLLQKEHWHAVVAGSLRGHTKEIKTAMSV